MVLEHSFISAHFVPIFFHHSPMGFCLIEAGGLHIIALG